MDSTRGKMAAMTMVGGDHFFLERWVEYYGRQLGRQNLFVLSHGGDPEHKRIAAGCNVIYLPFDETRDCFNQRRWQMLSRVTSGFTNFYNWVLVGDVDEIVAVDPDVSDNLVEYLSRLPERRGPKVISPRSMPWLTPTPTPTAMAATSAGHFAAGQELSPDGMRYRTPFNSSFDGNTVEMSVEQAQYGKAAADYQATLNFLENRVSGIRKALRGD